MRGGGYYDDHSEYQREVAGTAADLIAESVAAVPLPRAGRAFVIADYGASTGRNSIASTGAAAAAVRRRRPGQRVAVIHNDLPTNDWNRLFANVAASSEASADGGPVVPLASAVSFFEPAAPAGSVHVGLSFSAAHWLREAPAVVVPEAFYFCEATGAVRAALAAQADADWTSFLASRAVDLAAGGRLVVQTIGTDPGSGGGPRVTARKLLLAMTDVARDLVDEGALRTAFERYLLPAYARTAEEASAPLERAGSPTAGAFELIACRTDPVANPYLDRWAADGDAEAYGHSYAAFVRAFTESSLRRGLFAPGALGGRRPDALLDDYFARLTERFSADPERDPFEDWTLTVVLERRGRRRRARPA
jgi:hypothetical protein